MEMSESPSRPSSAGSPEAMDFGAALAAERAAADAKLTAAAAEVAALREELEALRVGMPPPGLLEEGQLAALRDAAQEDAAYIHRLEKAVLEERTAATKAHAALLDERVARAEAEERLAQTTNDAHTSITRLRGELSATEGERAEATRAYESAAAAMQAKVTAALARVAAHSTRAASTEELLALEGGDVVAYVGELRQALQEQEGANHALRQDLAAARLRAAGEVREADRERAAVMGENDELREVVAALADDARRKCDAQAVLAARVEDLQRRLAARGVEEAAVLSIAADSELLANCRATHLVAAEQEAVELTLQTQDLEGQCIELTSAKDTLTARLKTAYSTEQALRTALRTIATEGGGAVSPVVVSPRPGARTPGSTPPASPAFLAADAVTATIHSYKRNRREVKQRQMSSGVLTANLLGALLPAASPSARQRQLSVPRQPSVSADRMWNITATQSMEDVSFVAPLAAPSSDADVAAALAALKMLIESLRAAEARAAAAAAARDEEKAGKEAAREAHAAALRDAAEEVAAEREAAAAAQALAADATSEGRAMAAARAADREALAGALRSAEEMKQAMDEAAAAAAAEQARLGMELADVQIDLSAAEATAREVPILQEQLEALRAAAAQLRRELAEAAETAAAQAEAVGAQARRDAAIAKMEAEQAAVGEAVAGLVEAAVQLSAAVGGEEAPDRDALAPLGVCEKVHAVAAVMDEARRRLGEMDAAHTALADKHAAGEAERTVLEHALAARDAQLHEACAAREVLAAELAAARAAAAALDAEVARRAEVDAHAAQLGSAITVLQASEDHALRDSAFYKSIVVDLVAAGNPEAMALLEAARVGGGGGAAVPVAAQAENVTLRCEVADTRLACDTLAADNLVLKAAVGALEAELAAGRRGHEALRAALQEYAGHVGAARQSLATLLRNSRFAALLSDVPMYVNELKSVLTGMTAGRAGVKQAAAITLDWLQAHAPAPTPVRADGSPARSPAPLPSPAPAAHVSPALSTRMEPPAPAARASPALSDRTEPPAPAPPPVAMAAWGDARLLASPVRCVPESRSMSPVHPCRACSASPDPAPRPPPAPHVDPPKKAKDPPRPRRGAASLGERLRRLDASKTAAWRPKRP